MYLENFTFTTKQNIPKEGAYVIACTHTGWVDVLYLGITLLPNKIHFMEKKQLFTNKLIGWFLRKLSAFPVDRANPGPSGTRIEEQTALKQGACSAFKSTYHTRSICGSK